MTQQLQNWKAGLTTYEVWKLETPTRQEVLSFVYLAWNQLSKKSIASGFSKAGFCFPSSFSENELDDLDDAPENLENMIMSSNTCKTRVKTGRVDEELM